MPNPTSKSHLYRLGVLLLGAIAVFGVVLLVASPASWNYDIGYWMRKDSLEEMKRQPLVYGGIEDVSFSTRNEACQPCHEAGIKKLKRFRHKGLSCESCHGALADHVKQGKRFAAAKVDKSRWQCENCHAERVNRPRGFPQFSRLGEIGKFVRKHRDLDDATPCLKCHDAHDPTP